MSGVEAVGLALAVLPLLISTAEHYDSCLRPFQRYKHFAREADCFRHLLSIEKTKFRHECRLLPEEFVDHDVARGILSGGSPSSPGDTTLETSFTRLLGDSKEACFNVAEMIRQKLQEIEDKSQEFWRILDEDRQVVDFLVSPGSSSYIKHELND